MHKPFVLFICSILSLWGCATHAQNVRKFQFGDTTIQFEKPRPIRGSANHRIEWTRLYFIKDEHRYELFKNTGDPVTFNPVKPESISKDGAYFVFSRINYGAVGGKQYCTVIKTSNGCVVYESSSVCGAVWSPLPNEAHILVTLPPDNDDWSQPIDEDYRLDMDQRYSQTVFDYVTHKYDDENYYGELNRQLCTQNLQIP